MFGILFRYFYNKRTKMSSWEKPLELMTPVEVSHMLSTCVFLTCSFSLFLCTSHLTSKSFLVSWININICFFKRSLSFLLFTLIELYIYIFSFALHVSMFVDAHGNLRKYAHFELWRRTQFLKAGNKLLLHMF